MFDAVESMRAILLTDADLGLQVGTNIFGGVLPEEYDPKGNPALVVNQIGGTANPELPEQSPLVSIHIWCGINEFTLVKQAYFAVVNAIIGKNNITFGDRGRLLTAYETQLPVDMVDPDNGWAGMVMKVQTIMTPSNSDSPVLENSFIIDGGEIG